MPIHRRVSDELSPEVHKMVDAFRDKAYLQALNITLSEWESESNTEAYEYLQDL